MATSGDNHQPSHASVPLAQLREILNDAREADDADRIHVALIQVLDGLINRVEEQDRRIAALMSDLSHKQGIVTNIHDRAAPNATPNEA